MKKKQTDWLDVASIGVLNVAKNQLSVEMFSFIKRTLAEKMDVPLYKMVCPKEVTTTAEAVDYIFENFNHLKLPVLTIKNKDYYLLSIIEEKIACIDHKELTTLTIYDLKSIDCYSDFINILLCFERWEKIYNK